MVLVKVLRDTLIIIAITVAIPTVIELVLRAAYPEKLSNNKTLLATLAYEHNDSYLISLKPNIEKEFKPDKENGGETVTWKTNSFSFRGEETGKKTGLRIIVYGDSNIQARFTQNRNTYPAVLQNLLKTKYKNAEVINAGLVGTGPDQSLIRLSEDIDKIAPDIVIFHVFADNDYGDIIRNRLFEISEHGQLVKTRHPITKDQEITSREPTFSNWLKSLLSVRAVLKLVSNEIDINTLSEKEKTKKTLKDLERQSKIEYDIYREHRAREISHFADHYDIDIATDPNADSSRTKVMLMEKILLEAKNLVNAKQIAFLVVVQPSVFDLTSGTGYLSHQDLEKYKNYKQDNLTKPFRNICKTHNLSCVHLIDDFLQNKPNSLYRKNDNHWNVKGQRISAEATAVKIMEILN